MNEPAALVVSSAHVYSRSIPALRPCLTHVSVRSAESRGFVWPASWRGRRLWCERDPVPKCRRGASNAAGGGGARAERGVACALRAAAAAGEACQSAVARSRLSRRLSVSYRYHHRRFIHTGLAEIRICLFFCSGDHSDLNEDYYKVMSGEDRATEPCRSRVKS